MKIKNPKKIIASILLVYILLLVYFTASEILEKPKIAKQITGSSVGIVGINLVSQCSMNLVPGFNLISICANATNLSVAKILEDLEGKYEFVLRWNTSTQEFDTYSPEAEFETNGFGSFELNESYLIYMKEAKILTILGEELEDLNISLIEEYNAPSYPYTFTGNVTRYLADIISDVAFLSRWNASRQEFDTYSPEAAENPFYTIPKGEGQFIYMIYPAVLSYNKTDLRS
ncbi:hypothetical protein JXB27_02140 [Candidatus Woesearchaeota archaeon]|nr:hypothetical protein [Candidatus Woesearchaeota archaeon]